MKWRFTLRGTRVSTGSLTHRSADPSETSWTLHAEPGIPPGSTSHRSGRDALLKLARRLCSYDGGRIIVIDVGRVTHAMEWRDAGELDPDASGAWYEKKLDPRDFRSLA